MNDFSSRELVRMNLTGMDDAGRAKIRDYCIRALDTLQTSDDDWQKIAETLELLDEIESQ